MAALRLWSRSCSMSGAMILMEGRSSQQPPSIKQRNAAPPHWRRWVGRYEPGAGRVLCGCSKRLDNPRDTVVGLRCVIKKAGVAIGAGDCASTQASLSRRRRLI
jgi:hypothetical protein